MKKISKSGFSFLELAIASAIIGILAIVILSGDRIFSQSQLQSAQKLTKSSSITSIPGLRLWLEPSLNDSITGNQAGTNLSDGELVASWNDISGNNIDVSQEINKRQPQFIASAINGLPAIRFDGVDDVLTNNSGAISNGNNNYTMIAVWQKNAAGGESVIFTQDSNGCENGSGAGIMANNNSIGSYGCGADFNYYPTTLSLEENSPHISIVRVDKSQTNPTTIYLDGLRQASEASFIGGLNASIIGVGGSPNNGLNFNGDIAEIIVFDRALSPAELSAANKYLSKKHLGVNQEIRDQFFCTVANNEIFINSIYQGVGGTFNQGQPIATLACADATFLPISGNPSPTINCNADGNWSAVINDCALACTNVSGGLAGSNSQDNGTSTYTAQGGNITSITCKPGHSPTNGTPEISCGSDGIWSSVNNDCTLDCPLTPNGIIAGNASLQYTGTSSSAPSTTSLTYNTDVICVTNYSNTAGEPSATCNNGVWDTANSCTQQCSLSTLTTALSGTNSSGSSSNPAYTNQGIPATITCIGDYSGNVGITCGSNGNWNSITGFCNAQCTLGALDNALSTTNTQNQSTPSLTNFNAAGSIQCKTGYSATNGAPSITCGANGNWNNVVNNCVPQCTLDNLQTKLSTTNTQNQSTPGLTNFNAVGSIKCKTGYSATNGAPSITCGANGNWNNVVNNCTQNCSLANKQKFGNSIYNGSSTSLARGSSQLISCKSNIAQGSTPSVYCTPAGALNLHNDCCTSVVPPINIFYAISGMYDGTGNRDGGVQWRRNSITFSHHAYRMPGATGSGQVVPVCRYSYESCGIYGCFHQSTVNLRCSSGSIVFDSESRGSGSCSGNWGRSSDIGSCTQYKFYNNYQDKSGMFFNNANGVIYPWESPSGNQCSS
ncbi:MAG: prepilin-type N-terminal cleavage/methylation domain-containing protein [Rickettsiales bacterium]|jgi:prepilin-type N-terminal cleavage/methylation domain-containing protein